MKPAPFAYLFERFPSFVQTFCYREAVEMARQGMEPWVISLRRPEDAPTLAAEVPLEIFYLPEEKALRAEVESLRPGLPRYLRRALSRHRPEPDSQRLFEALWLAPHLRARGISHVHAHFGGMAARTAWWLRRLYGFTYSYTGHANDIFCENPFPVTNRALVEEARFIVTETDFARRWMEQHHPPAAGKTFRVFNGIEPTGFLPREALPGPVRILSIGRYVEKKGFGDLIEACRLLQEQGVSFQCHLVGGGPLELSLQAQIERAGLRGSVHLLGPRAQAEVRVLLAQATVFVLACVQEKEGGSDNLPTVVMEAMMAGVPVVSTRVAGVPEMIRHGEEGLLVSPGASGELAASLRKLLQDPVCAAELARAAQAAAREKFALAHTTAELKRLLVRAAPLTPPPAALAREPALAALTRPAPGRFRRFCARVFGRK